jgi:hypothetical protein
MNRNNLRRKIERIKHRIAALGPLRPGTLYKRESVCGKPGCRCSRRRKPVRHGPYHYLSYTFEGKSHTEFVPADQVDRVKEQVRNYTRLMALVRSLVDCSIKLAKLRKGR